MHKNRLINLLFGGLLGLILMTTAQAGIPVWTIVPVAGYPPAVTVSTVDTATIQYTVTNQSHRSHTLQMKPIRGITSSGCTSPLGYQQSCTLNLNVTGSALAGDVIGGPVLCEQGSPAQCYQPSPANSLAIRLTQQPIQYTVTPSAGANGSISPNTPQVVNSGSTLNFTATPASGYGVDEWLLDGVPVQTSGTTYQLVNITANHTVNVTFGTVTLTPSVSSLGLSINCLPLSACATTQDAALTGNPRQITIQNTGALDADNVAVNTSGLPSGTSITSNTCTGTLNPGNSCVITLTPGAVASSDLSSNPCTSGTQPVNGTVTVSADGSSISTQVSVVVLSYGCQYQDGFIYAVDDATPNTGSIGGKAVSLVDQADPYITSGPQATSTIWSSNGTSGVINVSNDVIPLIGEVPSVDTDYNTAETAFNATYSNTGIFPFPPSGSFSSCTGATDGACNSANILALYNTYITNYGIGGAPYTLAPGPTNSSYYAAGICTENISGHLDWFLPAVCEMDAVDVDVACPPSTQNMLGNLSFLIGNPSAGTPSTSCTPPIGTTCLAGYYWSSTGDSSVFTYIQAWDVYFDNVGATFQDREGKNVVIGVRCARALTA